MRTSSSKRNCFLLFTVQRELSALWCVLNKWQQPFLSQHATIITRSVFARTNNYAFQLCFQNVADSDLSAGCRWTLITYTYCKQPTRANVPSNYTPRKLPKESYTLDNAPRYYTININPTARSWDFLQITYHLPGYALALNFTKIDSLLCFSAIWFDETRTLLYLNSLKVARYSTLTRILPHD